MDCSGPVCDKEYLLQRCFVYWNTYSGSHHLHTSLLPASSCRSTRKRGYVLVNNLSYSNSLTNERKPTRKKSRNVHRQQDIDENVTAAASDNQRGSRGEYNGDEDENSI